ncbi:MAG: hypothetical protein HC925_05805 [Coleofasciculaceae cyanobacterium SM2_3_26]|nr:hypothetical protein [Coleofasciculaceae cyanobacterium SM2_3_26]
MPDSLASKILNLAIQQYQQYPAPDSAIALLRQIRETIARMWLATPSDRLEEIYRQELGEVHNLLLKSGIKYEAIAPSELSFANALRDRVALGFQAELSLQYLLAAMLYYRADELNLHYQNAPIPRWFLDELIPYMVEFPSYFQHLGDVERYAQFIIDLTGFIHRHYLQNPQSAIWQQVALSFTNRSNFVPLYFSQKNLKEVYCQRADIRETLLKTQGNVLDWEFSQGVSDRTKIHLGILNYMFTIHPETFATIPLFEYLDREKFDITIFVIELKGKPIEQYCEQRADRLVQLSSELKEQVQTIRDANLDILLFGSILTNALQRTILLAQHRLAPIQIAHFASPATTGIRHMDHFLSGEFAEPDTDTQAHYREKLLPLKGTGFCFSYAVEPERSQPLKQRSDLGIPTDAIAYISAANLFKIIPEVRVTWVNAIAAVPGSVLVLMPFGPSWARNYPRSAFATKMRSLFAEQHIDPARLILLDTLPTRADVKAVLQLGDIYLNAYPYAGSTSIVDALEVGLPPVVMDGDSLRSRMGAALLRDLHLPELIADSEAAYLEIAKRLATEPAWRRELQQIIRQKWSRSLTF